MNATSAKGFVFPTRNRLDAVEREAALTRKAEIDTTLADADVRGFAEGLARGREAAHAEARELLESSYRDGREEGRVAGVAEMQAATSALTAALDAFQAQGAQLFAEAEDFCVELALAVVGRIVEVDKSCAEFVRSSTQAALKTLAPLAPTAVYLSPADFKLAAKAMSGLPVQEDAGLAPGTSRVEAGRLVVESSIAEAFATVRSAVIEVKNKRNRNSTTVAPRKSNAA